MNGPDRAGWLPAAGGFGRAAKVAGAAMDEDRLS
jgi:hypothetical protein